jgi:hypothetical protein
MSFLASLGFLASFFLVCAVLALMVLFPVLVPIVIVVGAVLAFIALLALLALYPISIIWAYRDANSRGKSGVALALLVALSPLCAFIAWPLSLLAWVVLRPDKQLAYRNLGPSSFASAGHA